MGSPLGEAISTTTVDGQNSVNVTGGMIQASGFGISAISDGNGAITVDMTGGQINSGLTGVGVAT